MCVCVCACHPQVSSQHPYAEQYIGSPHVMTVDYNNSQEFDTAIREIMRTKVRRLLLAVLATVLCFVLVPFPGSARQKAEEVWSVLFPLAFLI